MKTTVDLPQALVEAAKQYAAQKGLTLEALVEAGLRKILEDARTSQPFKLRKVSVGGQGLRPGMDWPRIRDEVYRGRGA